MRHWWIATVKYWLGLVPWSFHMRDIQKCEWCFIPFCTFPNSDLEFCSVACRRGLAVTPWWTDRRNSMDSDLTNNRKCGILTTVTSC